MQAATSLVKAHRTHGHLAARLDPLGSEPVGDPALEPATVGLTPEVMERIPAHILRIQVPGATLAEALPHLRETYCGTIAYEIEHISDHQQRVWLRQPDRVRQVPAAAVAGGEEARPEPAHRRGGARDLHPPRVPGREELLDRGPRHADPDAGRDVRAGGGRGRARRLHGHGAPRAAERARARGRPALRGDPGRVRGRQGPRRRHRAPARRHGRRQVPPGRDRAPTRTDEGKEINVALASNPSHLEFVDPVVEGRARAQQTERDEPIAKHFPRRALPVLIHGDAAFPGEGVVAETLNLEALDGYSTGGVLHIIANNQIGFTTEPDESRSTRYASDLAKGFDIPIVHVNADDPEACIAAVRLAMAYREEWRRGVVIDLIGYRRLRAQRGRRARVHAAAHVRRDQEAPARAQDLRRPARRAGHPAGRGAGPDARGREGSASTEAHEHVKHQEGPPTGELQLDRTPERGARHVAPRWSELLELNRQVFSAPEGFNVHRKLAPQREKRAQVGADDPVDWGQAEALAFATLLVQGRPLRLTGQDTARGTFSQRHLVLRRRQDGRALRARSSTWRRRRRRSRSTTARCRRRARSGSSTATASQAPETLVMWEAQFGDFVNAAQVAVDQFIVSGPREVGRDVTAHAAAAARLRGRRPRALERARGALPDAGRGGQHPRRERLHAPPSTSTCSGARRWSRRSGR